MKILKLVNINIGICIVFFAVALIYRAFALSANIPFWVDEFSTGTSARLIQENGLNVYLNPPSGFETNNSLTYIITAILFALFGQTEGVARIPAVLIGSLVPLAIYSTSKKIAGKKAGFAAALFAATSYFQIVWSLQARSYMMLQLAIVLTLLVGIRLIDSKIVKKIDFAALCIIAVIGITSHYIYFIALGIVILWAIVVRRRELARNSKATLVLMVSMALMFLFLWGIGFVKSIWIFVNSSFFLSNNLWYYHPFLWREYGLLLMMAIFGFALIAKKKGAYIGLLATYFLAHLVFVTFFFGHHMSKYLLPIFPILFIGAGVFVAEIAEIVAERVGEITLNSKIKLSVGLIGAVFALGFAGFIVANGHKFVTKPKKYYSINHDFREISNIDYHEVYKIIKNGIANSKDKEVAVIETWPGRAYWYLKQDYEPLYVFRWQDGEEVINGHSKKMDYKVASDGEKRLTDKIGFVSEEKDLKLAMKKYTAGFLFVDDDTMPREVIDYAEKNLKKELFIDHYPLDDNPYSKWPATLYSWGID